MSKNALGTIIRIIGIFFSLIALWFLGVGVLYLVACYALSITPTLFGYSVGMGAVILFRMFYPKNVFV